MNLSADDVRTICAGGEGRQVEFKRGLPGPAKAARSLCAFANTRGGMLLVGVTDHGQVYGVEHARAVVASLRRFARDRVQPPLRVEVVSVAVGEEWVVCCSVPLSPERPHLLLHEDGKEELVVRAGSSNRRATGATLEALRRPRRAKTPSPLERSVLAWVEGRADATVARFAKAHNVGVQRARRAFVELERAGRLVAHGLGARRVYERA